MTQGVRVYEPPVGSPDSDVIDTVDIDYSQAQDGSDIRKRQIFRLGDQPDGHHVFAINSSVEAGVTDTVVTVIAPANYTLTGFTATGTGDGYFLLLVDGSPVVSERINNIRRSCRQTLPCGRSIQAGAIVTLTVRNDALGNNEYEGTVFGEVTSHV